MRWRGIFKGLSRDRELGDFFRNLRTSLFYKGLSNELNMSGSIALDTTFLRINYYKHTKNKN
jgi:hypothetical protein